MKQLVLKAVSWLWIKVAASANSGLMTAPRRPAWPLNLLEAVRRNEQMKCINLDPQEMENKAT